MKCKTLYRDLDKFRAYRNAYKRRYRSKRDFSKGGNVEWSEEEIRLVMEHRYPDTEIARMIGRSVQAVQNKRCRVKKQW